MENSHYNAECVNTGALKSSFIAGWKLGVNEREITKHIKWSGMERETPVVCITGHEMFIHAGSVNHHSQDPG